MCLAIPGRLIEVNGEDIERTGKVDFDGVTSQVSLAFVPEANAGDYVIVHAGVAISRIDESEARLVFEYLRKLAENNK